MARSRKLTLIVIFSIIPCVIYAALSFLGIHLYTHTTLAKIVLFCAFPAAYSALAKDDAAVGSLKFRANAAFKASAAIGITAAVVIFGGFFLLRNMFDDAMILGALNEEGITRSNFPLVFINIVIVNAFLEELFFRGFVFRAIYNLGFSRTAYAYSSALFAVYHVTMISSWFSPVIFTLCMAGLFAGGLIFGETVRRCGSVYGAYIIHAGANLGINAVGIYLFLSQGV